MSYETEKSSAIRNYLLGEPSESGAEEIERWYFADGRRVDEVWAVFGEIVEEYLSGQLSESQSRRFERRLRSAPALRVMFNTEKALYNRAARMAARTSHGAEINNSISNIERRPSARARFPQIRWIAVAGSLVITAFIAWFALRTREGGIPVSPESSRQTASKDQPSPGGMDRPPADPQGSPQSGRDVNDKRAETTPPSKAPTPTQGRPGSKIAQGVIATFLLSNPGVRGEQNELILEIPVQARFVQFELELSDDGCATYSAVLYAESGEAIQRWEKLRARSDHSIRRVTLRAPAGSLNNGSYAIRLNCISNSVPAEQFHFKVEKK